jgi:hypothetical protein
MKKKIFFIIIILVILLAIIIINLVRLNKNTNQEQLLTEEFCVNQIYYYSSANAISNTTNYQNPEWNLNIYQYTDIAIYVNRLFENTQQNYIKRVYLSDFNILEKESSDVLIYYLNPTKFGSEEIESENVIENELEYNVINSENSQNDIRL